ncbi:MAG: LLM class flavin-dependent oxidoreductase [Alphaproteobacteria bacterium]|nr:LLM class flavin-dependent oxidoreductase [Alphaproteobacteria bacterium]MBV9152418.1 LLM class flavin-dependent oxidoreductase [Alphaproteobacteria bacterium]
MRFAIAIPTDADSWRLVRRAEELGFSRAWFYDTQMLSADPFVAMAAAAMKTTKIRLATGVLVPSNRIAPVAANAFASLNKLAPGRVDFGVGTGFTARRAMGLGAVKLADLETYVHAVMALLRGETIEAEIEGQSRLIRLLNPELGLINTQDPIGLYVAAAGPRARKLTARLGAGWINATGDVATAVVALEQMRIEWLEGGHPRDALEAVALTGGVVLEAGEPADSPRAIAQAGPRAAMLLHRAADAALLGLPPIAAFPPAVADAVAGYVALARQFRPQGAPYLENHRGHLMFVKPEERSFVTADLIRLTGFAAPERELKERFAQLAEAGYSEVAIQIVPGQEHAIEDWGRIRRAFA